MEPLSIFTRLANFAKESVQKRLFETFGGFCMGLFSSEHILFSGVLANLVGPLWWIAKGVGTVILAFSSAFATSYGAGLGKKILQKKEVIPSGKEKDKAA